MIDIKKKATLDFVAFNWLDTWFAGAFAFHFA